MAPPTRLWRPEDLNRLKELELTNQHAYMMGLRSKVMGFERERELYLSALREGLQLGLDFHVPGGGEEEAGTSMGNGLRGEGLRRALDQDDEEDGWAGEEESDEEDEEKEGTRRGEVKQGGKTEGDTGSAGAPRPRLGRAAASAHQGQAAAEAASAEAGLSEVLLEGVRRNKMKQVQQSRIAAHEKAEALWRLHTEKARLTNSLLAARLNNADHAYELHTLRLLRILDRERMEQLLEATDPVGSGEEGAAGGGAQQKQRGQWHEGVEGGGGVGGRKGPRLERVSPRVIQDLEKALKAAQEHVLRTTTETRALVSSNLSAKTTEDKEVMSEVAGLQTEVHALRDKVHDAEDMLCQTVLDILTLRHNAFVGQRQMWEEKGIVEDKLAALEREVSSTKARLGVEKAQMASKIEHTTKGMLTDLTRKLEMKTVAMCLLKEQHDQAERLFKERRAKLGLKLEHWRTKHSKLRRRCRLEVEGYKTALAELARRVEARKTDPRKVHVRSGLVGGPHEGVGLWDDTSSVSVSSAEEAEEGGGRGGVEFQLRKG